MSGRLAGKRVLVTQAEDYMGPATIELFREEGAEVIADNSDLTQPGRCEELISGNGEIDVLIANLASPNFTGIPVTELTAEDWHCTFDMMVHPLHRLCQAVLPQMIARLKQEGPPPLGATPEVCQRKVRSAAERALFCLIALMYVARSLAMVHARLGAMSLSYTHRQRRPVPPNAA